MIQAVVRLLLVHGFTYLAGGVMNLLEHGMGTCVAVSTQVDGPSQGLLCSVQKVSLSRRIALVTVALRSIRGPFSCSLDQ